MDKTITAYTSTDLAGDPESYWFSSQWLRGSRHLAVRSAPVIAVVQELATILRDEQTPAPHALLALRRAVRLLAVLAGGTRDENRRREDYRHDLDIDLDVERGRILDLEDAARSVNSTRFAATWLRGSPAEAIRTAPVIAIVDTLLGDLTGVAPAAEVYRRLRHAVQVLSVFAREDRHEPDHRPER
ncbi:hypothetical protein ACFQS1_18730 [Paractinoplanes rhizophilus]|uniref:Uncharacterized protein n=1 Tax=Paractinoplanes rhizophilus TaxID=1416877 RepID=A0ABW2HSD9_9ACTN